MPESKLHETKPPEPSRTLCAYHVVRYVPNLVRDEWVNIGIVLFDAAGGMVLLRLMEDPAEFARLRRLHPQVDLTLLRRLPEEFEAQFAGMNVQGPQQAVVQPSEQLARLLQTLSNAVQLGPRKGLLTESLDAELDRLYHDQVEPLRHDRRSEDLSNRNAIRTRVNHVFRSAGIWARLERRVRVEEFTFAGDPLRLDYAYRCNGTQGFVQALPLGRDPGQAKVLAFTADAIRAKLAKTEFLAVSDVEPHPQENVRHRFVTGLLEKHEIPVLPLARLDEWAQRMRPSLFAPNGR
jgi:hypothetical protein